MGFNYIIDPAPEKRKNVYAGVLAGNADYRYTVWKVADGKNAGSWCEGARFIPVDDNVILVVWEHFETGEKRISVYEPDAFLQSSVSTEYEPAEDSFSMAFKYDRVPN